MKLNVSFRPVSFILLFAICAAVYGNTFFNGWTYDDIPVVVRNTDSHSLSGFMENSRPGRPLRELSYIPDYALFGINPAGYHVQQLLWHGANGCLLVLLFSAVGISPLYALLGAVFFLVHPLQSESVANISHRKELMPLFFCLAALLAYVKATAATGVKRVSLLILTLISYLCSLLSNETSITFPVLLVLYDYLYLRQEQRIVLKRPVVLLACAASAAAFFLYRYQWLLSPDQLLSVYSKYSFVASQSFYPLWMSDLKTFGFYLAHILLPIKLAPEYHVTFSEQIFQPWAWCSGLILFSAVYASYALRKSLPSVAFGIAWFIVFYLPISNILPVSYLLADRYMYMCLPGIALIVAAIAQKFQSQILTFALGVIICSFAVLTVIQNSYWKDEQTLWRHAVTVNPDSTWVQETVALSYLLSNDFAKARHHAKIALRLNRYNTRAYLTLAKSEDRLGNLHEAIKNYESFCAFGVYEFPDEVAAVKKYLPFLQTRAFLLYSAR